MSAYTRAPELRDANLHPSRFYWSDALGDYVAVYRYNAGDPQWATDQESRKLFKEPFIPQRMYKPPHDV